jgi:hypothetical protein
VGSLVCGTWRGDGGGVLAMVSVWQGASGGPRWRSGVYGRGPWRRRPFFFVDRCFALDFELPVGAAFDLQPRAAVTRLVRAPLWFGDHAFELVTLDHRPQRMTFFERRRDPPVRAGEFEALEQVASLPVRLVHDVLTLEAEHVERDERNRD